MPELPEVETMKRFLYSKILGEKITDVRVLNENSIAPTSLSTDTCRNKSITDIQRIGKKLFIYLSGGLIISVHFKMSGSFYLREIGEIDIHDRIIFFFSSFLLCFHDPRKFGKILISQNIEDAKQNLGIDALSNELDGNYLHALLREHNIGIKRFLLNQNFISGIGNIYADEILFASSIHPNTQSNCITQELSESLILHMKEILKKSILFGGTSLGNSESNYQVQGKRGKFQQHLKVFQKEGLCCPRCSHRIIKMKIAGRSTHFCPTCQHLL